MMLVVGNILRQVVQPKYVKVTSNLYLC